MSPFSVKSLIFLPGLDGTGISFEPLGALLPPDVRTQIVRYPTDRVLNFEQTVECAQAQIVSDPDAIVVAESFSGPVAIMLVASGRIRARALILCATFARSPRPAMLRLAKCLPMAALLKLPWPRPILKYCIEGGETAVAVLLALWQRIKPMVSAQVLVQRLEVIRRMDVRPWLPRLAVPCLYIQATGDRTVPAGALGDFTAAVADLRVARIKGPHFILQARSRESLNAIESFLRTE